MEMLVPILSVVTLIVLVIGCAVVVLKLLDRATLGSAKGTLERAADERQFQQRLSNAQWMELKDHFGFEMPAVLKDLYANRDRLNRGSFYVIPPRAADTDDHLYIARFEPADVQTLKDAWFPIRENRFPFASDDLGNYYFVDLSSRGDDPPVYFIDHDGGDVSLVAESLSAFVSWSTYAATATEDAP